MSNNNNNIEKLKRAIGIDFDHTHGPTSNNPNNKIPDPNEFIPSPQTTDTNKPKHPHIP